MNRKLKPRVLLLKHASKVSANFRRVLFNDPNEGVKLLRERLSIVAEQSFLLFT